MHLKKRVCKRCRKQYAASWKGANVWKWDKDDDERWKEDRLVDCPYYDEKWVSAKEPPHKNCPHVLDHLMT